MKQTIKKKKKYRYHDSNEIKVKTKLASYNRLGICENNTFEMMCQNSMLDITVIYKI